MHFPSFLNPRHLSSLSLLFLLTSITFTTATHTDSSAPPGLPFTPTLPLIDFRLSIPKSQLESLQKLLYLSPLSPSTYESTNRSLGIEGAWMKEAKRIWENEFDWRKWEKRVNEVMPQYMAEVESKKGNETFKIHFAGIWSEDREAVPLLLLHGWPGAFTEFLPLVEILRKSTNPSFHIIIPSLPGYVFSSRPPMDHDFTMWDVAGLMDNLMQGLGFGGGYIVQGGDLGSWLSEMMTHYEGCDGILLNMFVPGMLTEPLATHDWADVTPEELAALMRAEKFGTTGSAYAQIHATRPSTIGHVLAASPLALLAWIGEKYLDWTELDPSIESILELVSLYWFTETYPTSIYAYRQIFTAADHGDLAEQMKIKKPFGVSWFPYDLIPYPKAWTAKYGELIYFKHHKQGGHWPMMEVPEEFTKDIIEFVLALKKLKRKKGTVRDEL